MFFTRLGRAAVVGLLACLGHAQAAPPPAPALLTALDGEAQLVRGTQKSALADGVALAADDIVQTAPGTRMARIELAGGLSIALGPDTRLLLLPRVPGERFTGAQAYLLSGWAKIGAAKSTAAKVLSPAFDVQTAGSAVLSVTPAGGGLFAEGGALQASRGGTDTAVPAGQMLALADGQLAATPRPPAAFIQAMPRAFMDTLPPRAARFDGRTVEPRPLGTVAYADAQPWLNAPEPALRRALLPRWRPLVREADFRRQLQAELKAHPEWEPVLRPPERKKTY